MNGRLTYGEMIPGFPFAEVDPFAKADTVQNFIHQPHIVIGIDRLIEPFRKKPSKIACGLWRNFQAAGVAAAD
jgi:hypothetical protein